MGAAKKPLILRDHFTQIKIFQKEEQGRKNMQRSETKILTKLHCSLDYKEVVYVNYPYLGT